KPSTGVLKLLRLSIRCILFSNNFCNAPLTIVLARLKSCKTLLSRHHHSKKEEEEESHSRGTLSYLRNRPDTMSPFLFIFSVLLIASGSVYGRSVDSANDNTLTGDEPRTLDNEDAASSLLGTDLRFISRIYSDCAQRDLSSCLKMKLISAIDRASRMDVKVMEGVNFVQDPSALQDQSVEGNPLNEAELEASLPRDLQDKEDLLDGLIMEKVLGFFKTHTLQFKLSAEEGTQRDLSEEGRKKKKGSALLLLPLMMAATFIPIALTGLAVLAGKALIISKLALVLAGIIGLKKLLGSGGHHEQTYHVSGHGGSRSLQDAHTLAYRGYVTSQTK
ncbi:hypothetical protein C0J52_17066, partial [Blattella germanica]